MEFFLKGVKLGLTVTLGASLALLYRMLREKITLANTMSQIQRVELVLLGASGVGAVAVAGDANAMAAEASSCLGDIAEAVKDAVDVENVVPETDTIADICSMLLRAKDQLQESSAGIGVGAIGIGATIGVPDGASPMMYDGQNLLLRPRVESMFAVVPDVVAADPAQSLMIVDGQLGHITIGADGQGVFLTQLDPRQVETWLRGDVQRLRLVLGLALGAAAMAALAYVIYRYLTTRAPPPPPQPQQAAPAEDNRDPQSVCVVCLDRDRDVDILPCHHFCMCAACAGLLQALDPSCPICRTHIQDVVQLYRP